MTEILETTIQKFGKGGHIYVPKKLNKYIGCSVRVIISSLDAPKPQTEAPKVEAPAAAAPTPTEQKA